MSSVLTTLKNLIGIEEEDDHFDGDLIIFINTVFATLNQIGFGGDHCFTIEDSSLSWEEVTGGDPKFNFVQTYVSMKVKMAFDPPVSSAAMEALKRQIDELEWRIFVQADKPIVEEGVENQNG